MIVPEHILIVWLLLTGLLNAHSRLPGTVCWIMSAGVLLALFAPTVTFSLPWEWLAGVVIPMLLWQTAARVVNARWTAGWRDLLIWAMIALGVAGVIIFAARQPVTSGLLFGVLIASMAWRAVEDENRPSYLGQFGPLALAFLLGEVAPSVEAPGKYVLALLGGAGLGLVIGYFAYKASRCIPNGIWRSVLSVGQGYLAYLLAALLGLSGVGAALFSVALFMTVGTRKGLWEDGVIQPQPLNSSPIFILFGIGLALFAWQTHVPLTSALLIEIILCLVVVLLCIIAGKLLKNQNFLTEPNVFKIHARAGYLLVPAVLLWQCESLVDPAPLGLALALAALVSLGAHYTLDPLMNFYAWLQESSTSAEQPSNTSKNAQVKDVMFPSVITLSPEALVLDIIHKMTAQSGGCVLVVNNQGKMVDIITEADLFVKEERLPQIGRTYPALFKTPIYPHLLPDLYAQFAASQTAAMVMSTPVIWVKQDIPLDKAIQLMLEHGIKCFPVLDADPAFGGKLVGVLTRTGIIQRLSNPNPLLGECDGRKNTNQSGAACRNAQSAHSLACCRR